MKRSFLFVLLCNMLPARAQVVKTVQLDSVVIEAVRRGFDVRDFIGMVQSDTSFLRAFRNLRNSPHEATGIMNVYGKKHKQVASRYLTAVQHVGSGHRWMERTEEYTTGRFYDSDNEPETTTASLFDAIFFYTDTVQAVSLSESSASHNTGEHSTNISRIKTLVFQPGTPVSGVPIVGKRVAIFDEDMMEYYNYSIRADTFRDSISCYVFSCEAKPGAGDYPVLRSLHTWFDRRTFQIVHRDYQYRYSGLLFDFDVTMVVTMEYHDNILCPSRISYNGTWDLPLRKAETADFQINFKLLNQ